MIKKILKELGITEYRPCQSKALDAGVLEGKNLLVCTPTASGKTLVAEMALLRIILEKKGKVVYTVPLKSLASEKYKEFKKKYSKYGVKVALSIGDLDSSDSWLDKYNLIICSNEKLDSLIRHGAPWIKDVRLLVIDEIHLLNDPGRGPTLEIVITLLRKLIKDLQIVALSATVGNPEEMGEWLDAAVVLDDWRPVRLYQGVFEGDGLDFFEDKEMIVVDKYIADSTLRLALDTIRQGKQALVFCSTKKIAESTADKLSRLIKNVKLKELADKSLKALTRPTRQCNQLASCLEKGIAFHHAGLVSKQRSLIEDNFREGLIKVICCTPTLAYGLNLPAFRVIMKGLKRYTGRFGSDWIPVLEYHQMIGRAGRP
jgi:helicase